MKRLVAVFLMLPFFAWGCGEDWQRDLAGGLFAVFLDTDDAVPGTQGVDGGDGMDGFDGSDGSDGADGMIGADGMNGLNCWDFDEDGECDFADDWNGPDGFPDGICDAWDWQGRPGEQGDTGPAGSGPQGPQGPQGEKGDRGDDGNNGNPDPECTPVCHVFDDGSMRTIAGQDIDQHRAHGDACGACPPGD